MKAVYKKDLKSAFTGMIGWVLCAFVVVVVGLYFTAICLQSGYADFSLVLYNTTFIFLVVVPLLTMRSIVEERRQKTDQLLLTSPVSVSGIVMGKYLALVTIYAIPIAVLATYPLIMSKFGTVAFGSAYTNPLAIVGICPLVMRAYGSVSLARSYAALLAFFLMGAAAIAIGLFMSSLTENQIIAAVCTFGSLLFLYLMPSIAGLISGSAAASLAAFTVLAALLALFLHWMTKSLVLPSAVFCVLEGGLAAVYFLKPAWLEGLFPKLLNSLALFGRFDNFVNGLFDISSLVYFVSVALLFVFFTCQGFEKRRWS